MSRAQASSSERDGIWSLPNRARSTTLWAGKNLAKPQRTRIIADAAIKGVSLCAPDCRGQLHRFTPGRCGQMLGVLHQQFADAAPPRRSAKGARLPAVVVTA